jgi:hypothetical protein
LGFIGIVQRDRAACDGEDDGEKDFNVAPVSAGGPKDLRHLADALGVSTSLAEDSQRRPESFRGAVFLCRDLVAAI